MYIFVFTGKTVPTVTAGQTLATLQGIAEAFTPSTPSGAAPVTTSILEFEDVSIGTATAGTAPATGVSSTAAVAGSLANGTSLAGSLVTLAHAKVKAQGKFVQVTLVDNANGTIVMDDTAFFGYGGGSGFLGERSGRRDLLLQPHRRDDGRDDLVGQ